MKMEEGEKQLRLVTEQLEKTTIELNLLENNGSGITSTPLPIEDPNSIPTGESTIFWVTPCPICGLLYSCNNIVVSSCRCMYHPFCLGIHLQSKNIICVAPALGRFFLQLACKYRIPEVRCGAEKAKA